MIEARILTGSAPHIILTLPHWKGARVNGGSERKAMAVTVELKPGESQEGLLRRFRKSVTNSGILSVVRRKRWHISRSELQRIEKKKSIRRARRRQRKLSMMR